MSVEAVKWYSDVEGSKAHLNFMTSVSARMVLGEMSSPTKDLSVRYAGFSSDSTSIGALEVDWAIA